MSEQNNEELAFGVIPTPNRPSANLEVFNDRVVHDRLIAGIVRDMAGVEIDINPNTGEPVMRQGEFQIVSLRGARLIYNWLKTHINPITSLTQWNEDEVKQNLETTGEDFLMFVNENEILGLDERNITVVFDGFRTIYHSQLNKALQGMENERISVQQSQSTITQQLTQRNEAARRFEFLRGNEEDKNRGSAAQ